LGNIAVWLIATGRKSQITVRNGNLAIQQYGNPVTEKSNLAIGQYSSLLIATGRKSQITVRNGNLAIQQYGNPVTEK